MSVDRGVIPDPRERPPSVDLVPGDIVVVWSHPETVGFQDVDFKSGIFFSKASANSLERSACIFV